MTAISALSRRHFRNGKGHARPEMCRGLAVALLALVFSCVGAVGKEGKDAALKEANALNQQVFDLWKQGQYEQALPLAEKALKIREKFLGSEHSDTALSLFNLAAQFKALRNFAKAEPLYQRSLEIDEKLLGPESPHTATSLENLAALYQEMGDDAKAEPLLRRAREIRLKAPGTVGQEGKDAAIKEAEALNQQVFELWEEHKYEQAVPLAEKALEIREKLLGPEHPVTALSLFNLAAQFEGLRNFAKAEPLYRRALTIREKVLGPEHPDTVTSLENLAGLYGEMGDDAKAEPLSQRARAIRLKALETVGQEGKDAALKEAKELNQRVFELWQQGRYKQAVPLAKKALDIREKLLGPEHSDTAMSLFNLAAQLRALGNYAKAETLDRRALAIREKVLGPEHPSTAHSLNNLALDCQGAADYAKAEPLHRRALAIREKVLGPEDPDTATSLNNLATIYQAMSEYAKAKPLHRRALEIREKVLGPEDPVTATSLANLSVLYEIMGDYAKAEPLAQRALAIQEKALGTEHPDTAGSLHNLATIYQAMSEYAKAEPMYRRALEICEKVLGPEHPDTATSVSALAAFYEATGDYARAEPLARRALTITEKVRGPEHPQTATYLNNLATICQALGDYSRAEPLYRRALTITEKVLGPERPKTAASMTNLAGLYRDMGDYEKAEQLFRRALEIWEKEFGLEHPFTAGSLNNLAMLYQAMNDFAKAEPLFQRALKIREKVFGPQHPETAASLHNTSSFYYAIGDYAKAEPLSRRALEFWEKTLGPEHPATAGGLNNLATIYQGMGDYPRAAPLYRRALAIQEKVLGPEHAATALSLGNLAMLHAENSEAGKAHDYGARAIAAEQTNLGRVLSFASEPQRMAYKRANVSPLTHAAATGTPLEIATTVLRWKGVVLDSVMEDRVVARQAGEGELRERLEAMRSLKGRLMKLVVDVPKVLSLEARKNREQERTRLEKELATSEGEMSRKVSALGRSRRALGITVEQVQRALGPQEALLEFAGYLAYGGKNQWERRYGVVLLTAQGEPRWLQLGDAVDIYHAVELYQKSVRGKTDETALKRCVQTLYELIWLPIEKMLPKETDSIIISPDGPLSFVSLATLLDDQDRFLAERYAIRYVGSGRDLLSSRPAALRKELAFYGNADFRTGSDAKVSDASEATLVMRSADLHDFGKLNLPPLPGTADECRRLAKLATAAGWTVHNHLGADATESALMRDAHPSILHLATHGFFLTGEKVRNESSSDFGFQSGRPEPLLNNPMHRSGVALSGAQRTLEAWQKGKAPAPENDGILTADEVALLDLEGTWLVTLSACETGVGEARSGEGVLGLRRAFVQAGAGNLLMTLWPVNDQITADIMEDFYRRALATGDASHSLIETQREWLIKLRKDHGLLHAINRAGPFIMSSMGPSKSANR